MFDNVLGRSLTQVTDTVDALDEQSRSEGTITFEHALDEGQPPESEIIEEAVKKHGEGLRAERESVTEPDDDALPYGAGQRGHGPPMKIGRYERERDLCDGAGICSVGRWLPWSRPAVRDNRILAIRAALRRRVIQTIENTKGGLGALFSNLAGG